jgi:hypothetical protein
MPKLIFKKHKTHKKNTPKALKRPKLSQNYAKKPNLIQKGQKKPNLIQKRPKKAEFNGKRHRHRALKTDTAALQP